MLASGGRILRRSVLVVISLVGISLAALLAGCSSPSSSPPPPSVVAPIADRTLMTGGVERPYRVFAPGTLTPRRPAPLVVVLGGAGDSIDSTSNATEFDRQASLSGFVVVYAQDVSQGPWRAGFCCQGPASASRADVQYVNQLVDTVQARYRTDPTRIYAVGVSAGAMLAYRLACDDAGRFAGAGGVAGAMILDACHPSRPVSFIAINGTADPLVPEAGGTVAPRGVATVSAPSSRQMAERWSTLDSCPPTPTTATSGPVSTITWSGCASGVAVRLIVVAGGGHTWYAPGFGPADGAVDATPAIWNFLASSPRH